MEPITDPQSLAETMAATPEERLAAIAAAPGPGLVTAGDRIGRYVVLGPLGEGGMGVVVAAYDPELDRKVAIKILLPSRSPRARAHERLLREAQALARLSHPNVVAVHDVGTHDGRVFIAMEFIAGATLSATLGARRHSVAEVVGLYRMAGEGLAAAHRAGLVHRDFKPKSRFTSPERP